MFEVIPLPVLRTGCQDEYRRTTGRPLPPRNQSFESVILTFASINSQNDKRQELEREKVTDLFQAFNGMGNSRFSSMVA